MKPYPENDFLATDEGHVPGPDGLDPTSPSPSQHEYLWTRGYDRAHNRRREELEAHLVAQSWEVLDLAPPGHLSPLSSSVLAGLDLNRYFRRRSRFFPPPDFPQPHGRFRQLCASPVLARPPVGSSRGAQCEVENEDHSLGAVVEDLKNTSSHLRARTYAHVEVQNGVRCADVSTAPRGRRSWDRPERRLQEPNLQDVRSPDDHPDELHSRTAHAHDQHFIERDIVAPLDEVKHLDLGAFSSSSPAQNEELDPGEGPSSQHPKRLPLRNRQRCFQRSVTRCNRCMCRINCLCPHHSENHASLESDSTLSSPPTVPSESESRSPKFTAHSPSICSHAISLGLYCTACCTPSESGTGWKTGSAYDEHLKLLTASELGPLHLQCEKSSYARGYRDRERDESWEREVGDHAWELELLIITGRRPGFGELKGIFPDNLEAETRAWVEQQQGVGERVEDAVLRRYRLGRAVGELPGDGDGDGEGDGDYCPARRASERPTRTPHNAAAELAGVRSVAERGNGRHRAKVRGPFEMGESNGRGWEIYRMCLQWLYDAFVASGGSPIDQVMDPEERQRARREFERRRGVLADENAAHVVGDGCDEDMDEDPIPVEYRTAGLGSERRREMERMYMLWLQRTRWMG